MKYKNHNLHGILVVDKPVGVSSMAVVSRVRWAGGHCKTGHAGTLDPLATGVLVCCLGKATKSVPALMDATKVYDATIDLRCWSRTDDAEGPLESVPGIERPDTGAIDRVLGGLTGVIQQRPPDFSAVKVGGQRAYKLARKGEAVAIKSRPVRIDRIECLSFTWPILGIRVTCGKGTYIRSLARQIGHGLGTGGYLTTLRRLAVGPYGLAGARTWNSLAPELSPDDLWPPPDAGGSG